MKPWQLKCFAISSLLFITFSFSGCTNKAEAPKSTPEPTRKMVKGEFSQDNFKLIVTNKDTIDWENCSLIINNKYFYPKKISEWVAGEKIKKIEVSKSITVNLTDFTMTDGEKFKSSLTNIQILTLSCENAEAYWQ